MKTADADYFDGRSAVSHRSTVTLDGNLLRIRFDGRELQYHRDQVRLSEAVGSIPRSLRLPDGGICELHDKSFAACFEQKTGGSSISGCLHRLEISPTAVVASLLLCIMLVGGFILYGLPWLARRAAFSIPIVMEERLDRESLELLDRMLVKPSTLPPEKRQKVKQLFKQVQTGFPADFNYRLEFRQGAKLGANALALPGGTVILTDELLELADNDQALMAVLAHELTHIRNRHALRSLLQNSATALLLASVTGDISSITAIAATLPAMLAEARYSREFEREADDSAVQWLRAQKLPTRPYAELLAELQARLTVKNGATPEKERVRNYLSTHPDTAERIRRIIKTP